MKDDASGMKMINMLSSALPKEAMIEMLELSIARWKDDKSDKHFESIASMSMMINFRAMQESKGKAGLEGAIDINEIIDEGMEMKDLADRLKGKGGGTSE